MSDDDDDDLIPALIGHSVRDLVPTPSPRSAATKVADASKHGIKRQETKAFDKGSYEKEFQSITGRPGKMNLAGFRKAMGLMGLGKGNAALAEVLFKAIDKSDDSFINDNEYILALETMIKGDTDDKLKFAFRIMDHKKKGKVSQDDLMEVLSIFYRSFSSMLGVPEDADPHKPAIADIKQVVKTFDQDKDGCIEEKEWIAGIKKHPDIFSNLAHIVDPEAALKHWTKSSGIVEELIRLAGLLENNSPPDDKSLLGEGGSNSSALPPVPPAGIAAPDRTSQETPGADGAASPRLATATLKLAQGRSRPKIMTSMCHNLLLLKKHLDVMRSNMDHLKPVSALPLTLQVRRRSMAIAAKSSQASGVIAPVGAPVGAPASPVPGAATEEGAAGMEDMELAKQVTNADIMDTYSTNDWSLLKQRTAAFEKAPVVAFGSKYWNTSLSIMQGIQLAAVRATSEGNRPLSRHDFFVRDKYILKPSSIDPSAPDDRDRRVKFYDYAPRAFYCLRASWGLTPREYITTCGPGQIISNLVLGSLTAMSRMRSEGKSGDFFYTTGNSRYMLKTIAKKEFQTFRDMLPDYVQHMTVDNLNDRENPTPGLNSLICKFCGLHKMKTIVNGKVEKIYFTIMLNCNPADDMMQLHRRLDLKGSYRGRTTVKDLKVKTKLKQMPLNEKFDPILKDNDFDTCVHSIGQIRIGPERTRLLRKVMNADVKYLKRHNIMDYSLIIGCHYKVKSHDDLDRRPTQDFNNPSFQLREVLNARASLKRSEIVRGDYPKPYLVNIGQGADLAGLQQGSPRASMADLTAEVKKTAPVVKKRLSGYLEKRNDSFSFSQGRWSKRWFELHNMFLYYWDSESARKKDNGKNWKACWNLLRVDSNKIDREEATITLTFDDVSQSIAYTTKTIKCSDLSVLTEWYDSIQARLDYFQSGELEAEWRRKVERHDAALSTGSNSTAAPPSSEKPADSKVDAAATQLYDDHVLWGISAPDKSAVYFVGIVDCFTTFDNTRSVSYFFEGSTKSNVPPDLYAKRFYNVNKGRFA